MDRPPQNTRVIVISDQAISLRGMVSLVLSAPALSLVGEGCCQTDALQLCKKIQPDLILLDLKGNHDQVCVVLRQLGSVCESIRVLLLVSDLKECNLDDNNGANVTVFYLSRDVSEEEFMAAIHQVIQMRSHLSAQNAGPAHFQHQPDDNDPAAGEDPPGRRSDEVITRELVMAGKIQEDILPEVVPVIPGWEISARVEPARETSGDFYDFLTVADRKWGFVIADVTDKGMGAALFMVLCSTLIRTFAARFPTLPAIALKAVSERILADTRSGMFVTAFFGILETHTGRFVYANAGHPPGYLIRPQRAKDSIDQLRPTGMALGVSEDAHWKQKEVRLNPGDFLILYTDGITEAQNARGDFFGEDRLLDVVLGMPKSSAHLIHESLLNEVHRFVGSAPRMDDIALIVIRRMA